MKLKRLKIKQTLIKEILILFLAGIPFIVISMELDLLEKIYDFSRQHEQMEIDEFFILLIFLSIIITYYYIRKIFLLSSLNKDIEVKNTQLEKALDEVKQLRGILTICSVCKKVKIKDSYWQTIEEYISDNSEVQFSHGICRDCAKKMYPELLNSSNDMT